MRTVDRVLAFVCAVTAVFALSYAAGQIVGPVGPAGDPPPAQHDDQQDDQPHDPEGDGGH